jgi:hypothetical protein
VLSNKIELLIYIKKEYGSFKKYRGCLENYSFGQDVNAIISIIGSSFLTFSFKISAYMFL